MKQFQQISFLLFWCAILWVGTTHAQTQIDADIDGEAAGDQFGYSVSMPKANTVAIGAIGNDGNGSFAGHVRVYSLEVMTAIHTADEYSVIRLDV